MKKKILWSDETLFLWVLRTSDWVLWRTYKWLSTDGPQQTWQSLRWSKENKGKKTKQKNADVQSLLHHTQKDQRL